ncbi:MULTISPECIES: MarR family winged helix-turn-helix transcriptional regulator [unclassified Mesorhizobium]|uniref:MarR family winged helix-turn-helix transcriptional regulator n=1 Tax=unclassified Mesorhizobium TaxID=325217 RepID=UPI00109323B7|nr:MULTISPECIES: MarR family winged helix-turn-helix transcriptional regulator [unclassified Mesorhizobium]TGV15159.1 MarR family transcriptional regulator [Mesorhizobium sp. M8A.F.Ca.ET.173.01.1.1]TGQ77298.1 MarR family transcriptional regulator [Mesorhizobium sp. M8A.F.Ca.ET.207.01.1.1]TGS39052.1 MarR family transcriptional regulator [Mesorhizobium sp. M8A.F.Ca.ET.182.01.1.1]TGS77333.1 MarR family transcriptional regulator [Mesorhizobium sp. M8A.F.Ca.ET.181.01.1.1]TGT36284.1 MarR family tran
MARSFDFADKKTTVGPSSRVKKSKSSNQLSTRPTLTLPELLEGGDSQEFRHMMALLFASVSRLQSMRRALAGELGVSSTEFAVIMALYHIEGESGVRIKQIADYLHSAGANVTATVGRLQSEGWVTKVEDSEDSRAMLVKLTRKSRNTLDKSMPSISAINDVWFKGLRKDDVRVVTQFLERLIEQYGAAAAVANNLSILTESTD